MRTAIRLIVVLAIAATTVVAVQVAASAATAIEYGLVF